VVAVLERPVVERLARQSQERRRGLVQMLPLRSATRDLLALLLMDYTIYLWHVGTHRIGYLWRLHQVHHLDLDLDSTTALRFHFAEMVISIPHRMLQIFLIGTSPRALTAWQRLFFVSILFHHSNVRLPRRLESAMGLLLITPRLHGIHHSVVPSQTNSNWSSGLSLWDRLHGTLRLDAPPTGVRIGPPGGPVEAELAIGRSVTLPFRRTAAPTDA
jgi:sterol desaturase/sphingolipid hydroxylase (fatty acid hydroxylase superfamily)